MKTLSKIKLSIAMGLCVFGGVALTSTSKGMPVKAEEEVTSTTETVATSEETSETAVVVSEEVETWTEKLNTFKDTYLVPLLSGVSITSILSVIATFVFNVVKEKKLDKKLIESNTKLAEATAILATITKIYNDIAEDKKLNAETKQIISKTMNELVERFDVNNEKIAKVEKIEPILRLLVQLEVKIAKSSSDLIASGAIEDINEITKLIKEF